MALLAIGSEHFIARCSWLRYDYANQTSREGIFLVTLSAPWNASQDANPSKC